MDQRVPLKGPAIVRLAGWIVLGFSLFGMNPVGAVAGIVMIRYADRIAGKIAGTVKLPVTGGESGTEVDRRPPGREVGEKARGEGDLLAPCPFCRKMNEPNTGKCRYCGYAM